MSILQEYDEIRREIGEVEYQLINQFLECHKEYVLSDVYYKEGVYSIYEEWKKNN